MKLFSGNGIILFAAIIFTGIASANKTDAVRAPANIAGGTTYTAHGTTDLKTAMMLKYLLKNPHLRVQAQLQPRQKPAARQTEVMVNYTIKGKTDRQTVMKLKQLLQNSKHIKISAHANVNMNAPQISQNSVSSPYAMQGMNNFVPAYTPFYSKGIPPVYVRGNMVYYPIPINTKAVSKNQVQSMNSVAIRIASQ